MKKISGKTTARLVKDLTTCELLLSKIVQKKNASHKNERY